jgi:hypothetical protein
LKFLDNVKIKQNLFEIELRVLTFNSNHFDIILSLKTLRKYDLVTKFLHQFRHPVGEEGGRGLAIQATGSAKPEQVVTNPANATSEPTESDEEGQPLECLNARQIATANDADEPASPTLITGMAEQPIATDRLDNHISRAQKRQRSNTQQDEGSTDARSLKSDSLPNTAAKVHYELEGDDIVAREESQTWDVDSNVDISEGETECITKICGSEKFRQGMQTLVKEYKSIFSRILKSTPAKLPPLELAVNDTKWQVPANTRPPRMQSLARSEEISRQVAQMTNLNLIEKSLTPFHSQVHLVTKPNGKWRFTIDFRQLNSATTTEINWPLPNIAEMLQRLGQKRPKYFAKFDMTSGYHQTPLHENSKGLEHGSIT